MTKLMMLRRGLRVPPAALGKTLAQRRFADLENSGPRIVGVGEAKSWTPVAPTPLAWYKQPQFKRNLVNILLLASFANSAAIILSYKSQKREIDWNAKERIQTLRETIEKVRKGEEIDIRAALGTGDPEMEKRWTEGTYIKVNTPLTIPVLREIEDEDMIWQGKQQNSDSRNSPK